MVAESARSSGPILSGVLVSLPRAVPLRCVPCPPLSALPHVPSRTVFRAYSQLHLGGKWGPKLSFISFPSCLMHM